MTDRQKVQQDSMLAAVAEAPGVPIRVCSVARPNAAAGQVLVRIHASGINPLDTKIYAVECSDIPTVA